MPSAYLTISLSGSITVMAYPSCKSRLARYDPMPPRPRIRIFSVEICLGLNIIDVALLSQQDLQLDRFLCEIAIKSRWQQEVMDCPVFCNCFLGCRGWGRVDENYKRVMEQGWLNAVLALNTWLKGNGLTEWGCCDYYEQFRKTHVASGNWSE